MYVTHCVNVNSKGAFSRSSPPQHRVAGVVWCYVFKRLQCTAARRRDTSLNPVVCWCWAGMKCSVLCDVSTLLLQAMLQVASYTSVMHCLVRQFIVDCCCFCITRSHPLVYAQTSTTATTQYNVCLLTWLVVWRAGGRSGWRRRRRRTITLRNVS